MFIQAFIGTGPGDHITIMTIWDIIILTGIPIGIITHIGHIGIGTNHTTPIIITSRVTDLTEMYIIPEGVA